MSVGDYFEFASQFWMPLLFGTCALLGAALSVWFRDDSDRVEWPREEQ